MLSSEHTFALVLFAQSCGAGKGKPLHVRAKRTRAPSRAARGRDCRAWSAGRMATEGRRVLLVIDSSTRRVVSTRPLRPASLDADAMLAEYMAYQSLVRIKGTSHAWHRTHTSRRMAAGDVGA